jgi:hypothetical protein
MLIVTESLHVINHSAKDVPKKTQKSKKIGKTSSDCCSNLIVTKLQSAQFFDFV